MRLPTKCCWEIEKTQIKKFQADMLRFFDLNYPEIGQEIEEKKVLSDEMIGRIVEKAREFKEGF